jgi:hypothetical protein
MTASTRVDVALTVAIGVTGQLICFPVADE